MYTNDICKYTILVTGDNPECHFIIQKQYMILEEFDNKQLITTIMKYGKRKTATLIRMAIATPWIQSGRSGY